MSWVTFPLNDHYEVREDGAVRRVGGEVLAQGTLKRGAYKAVSLWRNNRGTLWRLNRVIALTFHGPPPSPKHHAAHEDGNKANNHKDNIRWKTRTENEADKIRHGTSNRGVRNGQAQITEATARLILADLRAGIRVRDVNIKYNLSRSHASAIKSGRLWKHLQHEHTIPSSNS